ncbi:hypothetical protein [Magnetospirillum sp. 15-1]|uniref:hypothetical protein n=1 Tax=Magnetospirillum sp. 15-1 TaxID=1979370 RepID=UPI000BBB9894|nr:hypothetical protein [Magnetospirillum sp. 15-1]
MDPRPIEQQLSTAEAKRFRRIQQDFKAIRPGGRSASFFIAEISRSIDAGLLLSAIILSGTLLELWFRDLLVIQVSKRNAAITGRADLIIIDKEIEGAGGADRGHEFSKIVDDLCRYGVIDSAEKVELNNFYRSIRVPFHHGLSGRLVSHSVLGDDEDMTLFLDELINDPNSRSRQLEDFVDNMAVDILDGVVKFLANHPL